jgi:ASC-1-like (ASCH) protein
MQKAHRKYGPLVRIGKKTVQMRLKDWCLVRNSIGNSFLFNKVPMRLALPIHKHCDKFMHHTDSLKQFSIRYSSLKMNTT